jgi:hypothetical protein
MSTEEKDDDLVMVGDGVEEGEQQETPPTDDDENLDALDDGDGEGSDDTRMGGGEAVDDERTEARRTERKTRRQRQKEARDRDQRELGFLRSRNEQLEKNYSDLNRRVTASETSQIDGRINQLDNAIKSADDVYAKAISAGEGDDAAEAMRIRDSLKEQRDGLRAYKDQGGSAPPEQQGPDPALVEQVRGWHERNNWFDFGRRDEDSAIAGAIDDMLIRDGYDPRTPEYYDELDARIGRRLPHLAKKGGRGNGAGDDQGGDDAGDQRGSQRTARGPKFRVGGRERPLKSNEVHISRERREAMEQAGVWDDPVLRKNYLKRYADWDREHANENA